MKKISLRAGLLALTGTVFSGCVTINIYFPAAAAEKAADKIIEEVWQLKPGEAGQSTPLPASPQPSAEP
ncbi:hypothetical protein [Nitrosovibrio sp. Nv17]|uniref:hypothetical protein n=1 Tax=Nitrosovibrio sp. Nv17 TaxID=1855339 RepID=UPI000908D383|nr:hypothetical protein [Nitrosovibrio sp. Nv17]SFW12129.1 hypothetical protein SAMN05216414_101337 [Nitrosovibrio sp. Nv17]